MAQAPGDNLFPCNTNELLSMIDPDALTNLNLNFSFTDSLPSAPGAELEILEQPKQRGFRFRYSCEGPSHGGLPGANSAKGKKSFPSVQILNYVGKARIEVTLVTASDPPQPHAHSLVGKNVVDGACVVEVGPDSGMGASFPNLGIQHVTKKNVKTVLKERHIKRKRLMNASGMSSGNEAMQVDVTKAGPSNREAVETLTKEELTRIDQMVEQEAKDMNLSSVRLCFQTYIPDAHGHFVTCLEPVYSHQIFDSKAASASELKICRIDKQSGFVQGGEEVYLLCDKVQREDIEVRFFENRENDKPWEAFGKFSTFDVHRQFAIVFKTPEYWNPAIERPVTVQIELRRKSDRETSASVEFTYKPTEFDPDQIGAKRRKKVPHHFSDFGAGGSSVMGGGAGPSGVDAGGAMTAPLNPAMFQTTWPSFGALGAAFPSFSASGLSGMFSGTGFPVGGFSGGLSGAGGDDIQQQYQSSSQDPPQGDMT